MAWDDDDLPDDDRDDDYDEDREGDDDYDEDEDEGERDDGERASSEDGFSGPDDAWSWHDDEGEDIEELADPRGGPGEGEDSDEEDC